MTRLDNHTMEEVFGVGPALCLRLAPSTTEEDDV